MYCCIIFNVNKTNLKNFVNDDFFVPNSVNSFKKWNPDIELILITNDNISKYTEEGFTWDNIGLLRVHVVDFLFKIGYSKVIMLGADTITCSRLDEFIDMNDCDLMCSLGPLYWPVKTKYWESPIIQYEHNGRMIQDNTFINADVVCFNTSKAADLVNKMTIKYFTNQSDQGGLNYCYINQKELGLNVKIVDFPYELSNFVYNIRSKGIAAGAFQMRKGKVYYGFDGPEISTVYPTSEYVVKEGKLFTKDGKIIKVFHIAESIGFLSNVSDGRLLTLDEQIDEIKTMWFNKDTVKFFTDHCNSIGFT